MKSITSSKLDAIHNTIAEISKNSRNEDQLNSSVLETIKQEGLEDYVVFKFRKNEGLVYELKNLSVTFDSGTQILGTNRINNWVNSGSTISKLIIKNCTFIPSNGSVETALSSNFMGHNNSEFIVEDSDFSETILAISDTRVVTFKNSTIKRVNSISACKHLTFEGCSYIGEVRVGDAVEKLLIKNTKIGTLNIDKVLIGKNIKVLHFSEDSKVLNDSLETYKVLQVIVASSLLNDKVQRHILYNKELESFVSQQGVDLDSKILFYINKIINKNGLSFIRPILWMFALNFSLILAIEIIRNHWCFNLDIFERAGSLMLNMIPIYSITESDDSALMIGLDGLRKITLAALYYLTISAALRFRFKL